MKNHWYVSLSNDYPHPNDCKYERIVMSVQMKRDYSIVEMTREATFQEIDACRLVYCGVGFFSEKHIQENLAKYIVDLRGGGHQ